MKKTDKSSVRLTPAVSIIKVSGFYLPLYSVLIFGSNEITGWKLVNLYVVLIFFGGNRSEILHNIGGKHRQAGYRFKSCLSVSIRSILILVAVISFLNHTLEMNSTFYPQGVQKKRSKHPNPAYLGKELPDLSPRCLYITTYMRHRRSAAGT